MSTEQWQRMKEIFGEALELPVEERDAFARGAAADDPEMLEALLGLLKESERDTDLWSRPALADAKALSQDEAPRFAASVLLARRFRVVRFIARGGMGEVYEAEDLELGERVALKAIRRHVALDAELRSRFKQEVQFSRRVTHPNVCRIFDLAQDDAADEGEPTLLLSMELIDGHTLAEYLRQNGPLTFRSALPLIEEIAAGLQAVHDAGIIHGDLKPGNVMLVVRPGETAAHARVMDFGMAFPVVKESPAAGGLPSRPDYQSEAPAAGSQTVTFCHWASGVRGGTPDYFAPEQIKGQPSTTATDVYALALVVGDLLGVPRAKRLRPDSELMPAGWARVLRRCLENDPARRYRRPADVAKALRSAVDRKAKAKRYAVVTACAALGLVVAAKQIDVFRGTANGLLMTQSSSFEVWRASPDGKLLAATSWDTGDLVLRDVKNAKVRRLTHRAATFQGEYGGALGAIFSPDGRQIVYDWAESATGREFRLIGTDGKGDRRLSPDIGLGSELLDWSPDGGRILVQVTEDSGVTKLGVLSPRDGSLEFLVNQPKLAQRGAVIFGADANSLVFDAPSPGDEGHEIHQLRLSGGESVVARHTGASKVVAWSSDRRRLIFSSDLDRGQQGLWAVSVSGGVAQGEARELLPDAKGWEPLGLSGTGRLFYRRDASKMDAYTAVVDLGTGRTVSPPQRVTERFIGSYANPNWSEDGKQLVVNSGWSDTSTTVGIYDTGTGRFRDLKTDLEVLRRPQWVEHGAAIMVTGASRERQSGFFRIDPQTGNATLFRTSKEVGSGFEGVWSKDGKLHFNRYQEPTRGIFRLNLETGERRDLYVPPPGVSLARENLALSPDGRMLAFHALSQRAGTSTLMVIPTDGGEARPLLVLKLPEAFQFGAFTWTPDSGRILAARSHPLNTSPADEKTSELWQVPVDGSAPQKIDFPAMFITCLRMNPDGKTIAFQYKTNRQEIWILQNFL